AVIEALIPVRRPPQDRPRVARAQGANHHVSNPGSVFEHDELVDRGGVDAELGARGFGVGDEARLETRIDPGAGDQFGAVGGSARFLVIDLALDVLLGGRGLIEKKIADRVDALGLMAELVLRMLVAGGGARFIAHDASLKRPARASDRKYRRELCRGFWPRRPTHHSG